MEYFFLGRLGTYTRNYDPIYTLLITNLFQPNLLSQITFYNKEIFIYPSLVWDIFYIYFDIKIQQNNRLKTLNHNLKKVQFFTCVIPVGCSEAGWGCWAIYFYSKFSMYPYFLFFYFCCWTHVPIIHMNWTRIIRTATAITTYEFRMFFFITWSLTLNSSSIPHYPLGS